MYGARMGAYLALLTDHDHTFISDYDLMQQKWEEINNRDPYAECENLESILKNKVGLDITTMQPNESKFFKRVYMNPPRPWMTNENIAHFMATKVV